MNKLLDNILKGYKKSNKQRRVRLLKKYSFNDEMVESDKVLDVIIAFDTTGSMASYRDEVRKVATSFVKELFNNIPNLNMEIIAFGDYCDTNSIRFQRSGLGNNQDKLVKFIKECKNTRGGDSDEFYEYVIQQVVRNTTWRSNSDKVFVLLGDAEPHEVGYTYNGQSYNISWQDEIDNAVNVGVNIHTVYVPTGAGTKSFYEKVANKTNGAFLEFKHIDKLPSVLQGIAYSKGNIDEFENMMEKALVEEDFVLTGYYKTILETI